MRFPLRLTADLALHLAGQPLRGKTQRPLIFPFAPMEGETHAPHSHKKSHNAQKSAAEIPAAVRDSTAPVVWLAGPDPLLHPATARWARSLLGCGRYVFLQTDGNLLRRRIHEFQPVPRFSFVVEFNGMQESNDLRAGRSDAFEASAEGIRVAKLSGFLTCAYTAIAADAPAGELRSLREFLQAQKVDGWVIVPVRAGNGHRAASRQELLEARQLIPSQRWRLFSELVEAAAQPRHGVEPSREFSREPQSKPEICDQGVQVP
jgi:hypothetical protein